MKILLTDTFLQSIPRGKDEYVFEKIKIFVDEYIKHKFNMSDLPLGFSVREIKGNKNNLRIFKLRINKGERILFTFSPDVLRQEFKKSIVFLDYCHHDKQILSGKMIGVDVDKIQSFEDDEPLFDLEIDDHYESFIYDPNDTITQVISVETMMEWANTKDEKAVYYLNDEQYECLQLDGSPVFIFGTAGSGKTTINIHKAIQLVQKQNHVGYFTYSNFLVQDAIKLFRKIETEHELNFSEEQKKKVHFHHFNSYLSVAVQQYKIVNYEQFMTWIVETQPYLLKQIQLPIFDIWKEIRGVLKGIIPKDWISFELNLNDMNIQDFHLKEMIRKKLVKLEDQVLYLNSQRIYEAKHTFMDEPTLVAVKLLHRSIEDYILNHSIISLEIYQKLDEQYCQYSTSQRNLIYEMAQKYQDWLKRDQLIDENDLARRFISKIKQDHKKKFDYIIADEIQDLTEIQMYCLLQLTQNKNNLMFSGDFNQTIKPTFFNTGRIESILKTSNSHLGFVKHLLKRNYRSSNEIVTLANQVISMRIETLGTYKDNDYFEEAVRQPFSPIFYLNATYENKVKLFETAIKRHYVAIVVANEFEKVKLEQLLNCRGGIFTVEEIKGIEKDYIICYNIVSTYLKSWKEILNQSRNISQYRFYFNLLYVAVTRARHYLCIVEDDLPQQMYERMMSDFSYQLEYNEIVLKLSEVSTDDQFYKEAQRYEKRELYKQAIASYEQSSLAEAKIDIKRCMALQFAQHGNFKEAAQILMKIKDYERAGECYLKDEDYLNYIKSQLYLGKKFEELQDFFHDIEIDIVSFVYKQPKKVKWLKTFNKSYATYMLRQLNTIDLIINQLDEMKQGGKNRGN